MKVSDALEARRAIKHFDASHQMPEDEYKKMMELVLKSPTSFNIQNWRFVRVTDVEKREAIRAASWDQAQVTDASVLFLLCADLKSWEKSPEHYWRDAPQEVQEMLVPMIGTFYEGREWIQRDEAMRSVGIASQSLMLLAKEMGYDSCPMIGFDQDAVAKIINLPDDHAIGMMLTIGKPLKDAWPRPGSIDFDTAVIDNSF
ncbi:MAG: nitroreductase family protein [Pseudomonadota bacterium]